MLAVERPDLVEQIRTEAQEALAPLRKKLDDLELERAVIEEKISAVKAEMKPFEDRLFGMDYADLVVEMSAEKREAFINSIVRWLDEGVRDGVIE